MDRGTEKGAGNRRKAWVTDSRHVMDAGRIFLSYVFDIAFFVNGAAIFVGA